MQMLALFMGVLVLAGWLFSWLTLPPYFGSEWFAFLPTDALVLLSSITFYLWLYLQPTEDIAPRHQLAAALFVGSIALAVGPAAAWLAPPSPTAASSATTCDSAARLESAAQYTVGIIILLLCVGFPTEPVYSLPTCTCMLVAARWRFSLLFTARYLQTFALTAVVEVILMCIVMIAVYMINSFARQAFVVNTILRKARSRRIEQLRDEKERLDFERAMLEKRLVCRSDSLSSELAVRLYSQLNDPSRTRPSDVVMGSVDVREASMRSTHTDRMPSDRTLVSVENSEPICSMPDRNSSPAYAEGLPMGGPFSVGDASPTTSARLSEWGHARQAEIELERQVHLQIEMEQRWVQETYEQQQHHYHPTTTSVNLVTSVNSVNHHHQSPNVCNHAPLGHLFGTCTARSRSSRGSKQSAANVPTAAVLPSVVIRLSGEHAPSEGSLDRLERGIPSHSDLRRSGPPASPSHPRQTCEPHDTSNPFES